MRIEMWDQFNTCWLALLQCQKDHTQEMLEQGRPPNPPQNLLEEPFLEQMGNELVRLCDSIERHGLVDYQIGVWEEEIISSMLIPGQGFYFSLIFCSLDSMPGATGRGWGGCLRRPYSG